MCGGTLEIQPGESVAVCDSCGSKQTIPNLSDERRANLYDRANHFRRANEFDKAMGIYEQILNEDNNDAEAHWSVVLCRYGIEYVEDPATHKRVPTVNRTQYTSILSDEDYKAALRLADGYQRDVYQTEAKAIDEIQKGILAISQREEPFDVFISYKETDAAGRRTPDSVLATDLYHQLTKEGFKVFLSRITLEDKLGQEYEPYIFAALNSAKVMVVVGTKPEYFNAVWVKNEWSRYLALIRSGEKKTLIPAYRDMDPYDLPDEFSHLMAQDMSKLGFMQDLIRGIKKLTETEKVKPVVKETTVINSGSNVNTSALLRRAFMFLEDGDWKSANEYSERVLDQEPENAQAYLAKLMAELYVRKKENLQQYPSPFDDRNTYQKIIRFGDVDLKDELQKYNKQIRQKNEEDRKENIYQSAVKEMESAYDADTYENAATEFGKIPGYRDADIKARQCKSKAEDCRKDIIYNEARQILTHAENTFYRESILESEYKKAILIFQKVIDWRDSQEQILLCERKIEEIHVKQERHQIELDQKAQAARIAAEKDARKRKTTITALILCVLLAAGAYFAFIKNLVPAGKYSEAQQLMASGNYEQAIALYKELNGYKDSPEQIEICRTAIKEEKYQQAISMMNDGKYDAAIPIFKGLKGYRDSSDKIEACHTAIKEEQYQKAIELNKSGDYSGAYQIFSIITDYKDVDSIIKTDKNLITAAYQAQFKVGEIVLFGTYEQDNNKSNVEDIEWIVLERDGNKALLLSKYALDCKPYNSSKEGITWDKCTLRSWLNGTFLNAAFSDGEQKKIITSKVTADSNPDYSTSPGNDTTDKVFLLSIIEANRYFSYDKDRQCTPTAYAKAEGCYANSERNTCWWWLRSPGRFTVCAAYVGPWGAVDRSSGGVVNSDSTAVRPALWINLDA